MILTQPPFQQQFSEVDGNLTPAWRMWMSNLQAVLRFHGQSIPVAKLPAGDFIGQMAYASDGRKSGEGAGAGTGVPVWYDGSVWLTFYDNSQVAA